MNQVLFTAEQMKLLSTVLSKESFNKVVEAFDYHVKLSWEPKLGDVVWWDGIAVDCDSNAKGFSYKMRVLLKASKQMSTEIILYEVHSIGISDHLRYEGWTTVEHLAPIEAEKASEQPHWECSDWVYDTICKKVVQLEWFDGKLGHWREYPNIFHTESKYGDCFVPITKKIMSRPLGQLVLNAYEDDHGSIYVMCVDMKDTKIFGKVVGRFAEELISEFKIPVWPFGSAQTI